MKSPQCRSYVILTWILQVITSGPRPSWSHVDSVFKWGPGLVECLIMSLSYLPLGAIFGCRAFKASSCFLLPHRASNEHRCRPLGAFRRPTRTARENSGHCVGRVQPLGGRKESIINTRNSGRPFLFREDHRNSYKKVPLTWSIYKEWWCGVKPHCKMHDGSDLRL